MPLTILGIPGSLRKASLNRALLRAAIGLAPPGVTIDTFDLSPIPPYNGDIELDPLASVLDLKARIRAADAILFSTPRVQLLHPRRPQECHRLGLAALRRQRLGR